MNYNTFGNGEVVVKKLAFFDAEEYPLKNF
jgi:hypothetical protein